MSSAVHGSVTGIAREDTLSSTLARRCMTIPLVFVAAALVLATSPLWLPLAWLVDRRRSPRTALRCGVFLFVYLGCEVLGLLACAVIWLASGAGLAGAAGRERCRRWSFALQMAWAWALFASAARIFRFHLELEGEEALAEAPLLVFPRHASVADTLLAPVLVSRPHGIRLRHVLKRELLWDPCLDVVGHRLPNYFTRRDSGDSESERRGVAALAAGLGTREGVLIYPEGTRFSPAKRVRVLERLRAGGHAELHARAEALRHVLPPRLGGPLALLEASPGVDVVFVAHTGFESAASVREIWRGSLVGRAVRVRCWRVPAAEIPTGRKDRVDWLYENWQRVDRFVGEAPRAAG